MGGGEGEERRTVGLHSPDTVVRAFHPPLSPPLEGGEPMMGVVGRWIDELSPPP